MKRAVIMGEKKVLTPSDLDLPSAWGWNITKAAHEMGISRPSLHDFLKKHNISKS